MAQNPDVLQEAGMDELLASIREIIEENSAAAPKSADARVGDVFSKEGGNNNGASVVGSAPHSRAQSAVMPDLRQDIRVRDNNAGGRNGFAVQQSAVPNNAGGALERPGGVPVQDSMNALAERIGLHHGDAVNNGAKMPIQTKPSRSQGAVAPFASMPPVSGGYVQQNSVSAGAVMNGGSLQNSSASGYGNNQGRSRFNPPAVDTSSHGIPYPARERLYAADISDGRGGVNSSPSMDYERSSNGRGVTHRLNDRRDGIGAERNLSADVVHSTETLLRPLIAQWLDEHFQDLFEKVLREEVQRFIQSMRRNDRGGY